MNRECSELLRGRDIMIMTESSQSQRRTSVRASIGFYAEIGIESN